MTPPSPPPPDPPRTRRPGQPALAVLGVALLLLLAYRGYAPGLGARPTDHRPAAHKIDLNSAERAELLQVPGIGPGLADAILAHRRDRGRFAAVDDLGAVHGVGGKTLEKVRPWVTVREPKAPEQPEVERLERKPVAPPAPVARTGKIRPGEPPIDVNTATRAELERLPGIGPVLADRIIDARQSAPFRAPTDLLRVGGIGPKKLESIRPFVVCGDAASDGRE